MKASPSSSVPLAAAYGALVVYASLYPLSGWHHPHGVWSLAALSLPWPRWWGWFDVISNLLGYLPLGALVFFAALRSGRGRSTAAALACGLPALLSLTMELVQNDLPHRVPSALDWVLNSAGAALGALLAAGANRMGMTLRWQSLRERWLVGRSALALTLLLLWPFGLLFPAPAPLGLGHLWPQLFDAVGALGGWIQDVPWAAQWASTWVAATIAVPEERLSPLAEGAVTTLGLLGPCLLAYTISRPGWRRLALVGGATVLGLVTTTLSTMLNFGPEHALSWRTPVVLPAVAAAMLLAALGAGLSRRAASALGLVVVTAQVVLVAQAPGDPYFAESLQAWEQGRFIRFHGVAQWVGWLWPYLLLAHLLRRISARGEYPD